ncbi:Zinc knuckle CX2CX4HX4C [Parasponia andersonii]|uniref:Zinc knuckle CX2CX4HX4C n=1 Tax=Parasponia andersonii TaxID=3476 RepID=A0A2P5CH15_PARAD|nr:Zinc knuckle CX2CX4HX4C [Parasponia andersonii]
MTEVSKEVSLLLQYKDLPDFCYNCGIIGHHYKECTRKSFDKTDSSNLVKNKYGPWMNASVPRSHSLVERRRDKLKFHKLMGHSKSKLDQDFDSADAGSDGESRPLFKEIREWEQE